MGLCATKRGAGSQRAVRSVCHMLLARNVVVGVGCFRRGDGLLYDLPSDERRASNRGSLVSATPRSSQVSSACRAPELALSRGWADSWHAAHRRSAPDRSPGPAATSGLAPPRWPHGPGRAGRHRLP
jgi:hypothetical protein